MPRSPILLAGAFSSLLLFATGLVLILWLGHWAITTETQRLGYLGVGLITALALVGFALALGFIGHLKSLAVKVGPLDATLDGDDDGPRHD